MKLHLDHQSTLNKVTGYGNNYIAVNSVHYNVPIFFGSIGKIHLWNIKTINDITTSSLEFLIKCIIEENNLENSSKDQNLLPIFQIRPEIILVGTGNKQHFLDQKIILPLIKSGIAIEVMKTRSAARTHNILSCEERNLLTALII